jgi:hypothetical protein
MNWRFVLRVRPAAFRRGRDHVLAHFDREVAAARAELERTLREVR